MTKPKAKIEIKKWEDFNLFDLTGVDEVEVFGDEKIVMTKKKLI